MAQLFILSYSDAVSFRDIRGHLGTIPSIVTSKRGTSERCYCTRRGWTDEQRYAIISPYFDGRIKMNGPYPEITNISSLAKLFFKSFISLKHLSDYRTVGLSDRRTIHASYDNISHLFPLLLTGHVVTYIVLIKGGASERCDFSQFGKRQFSYGIYN
jgi:hypothetical protein